MKVMNKPLTGATISQQATIPCQQEADAETSFLLSSDVGNQVTNTSGYLGYVGCYSGGLPDAVKKANLVVAGAGTVAVAGLGLAGAPAIALALPSAALFNAEVMSIVTQIDVAAALKNVNNAASYKAMHQAVDEIEEMLKDLLVGQVIPETVGNIKDIYAGAVSFIQAFENTETPTPTQGQTFSGTFSGPFGNVSACAGCQWAASLSGNATFVLSQNAGGTTGSADVPIVIGFALTYQADGVSCTSSPYSVDATGDLSISGSSISGTFVETGGVSPLTMIFSGTWSGTTITGSATISKTITPSSTDCQDQAQTLSTTISNIVLVKQ
jgi:hypothetical protein